MKLSKGMMIFAVVGVVVLALLGWLVGGYNGLVTQRNKVDQAAAQLASAYQRRFDLVPNLVESVKGAQAQEQKVFGDIAAARTQYGNAKTTDDKLAASQQYESALSRLLVVVENYPDLASTQTVQNLMIQLEGTENRIKVERDNYSAVATSYNTMIQRFPRNVLAGMFGFDKRDLYTAETGAETAPKVNLTQPSAVEEQQ
ncbi:LemA family protein [Candidatus Saccharibacteria bacterium]|nr:LemA family protein [Candidatus Saccharibacteria bacterium]